MDLSITKEYFVRPKRRLASRLQYPPRSPATLGGPLQTAPCAVLDTDDGIRLQSPRALLPVAKSALAAGGRRTALLHFRRNQTNRRSLPPFS